MRFGASGREVKITVCDCRVQDNQDFGSRGVNLVQHKEPAFRKRLKELRLMESAVCVDKTGELVFLRDSVREVKLNTERFGHLFAKNVLAAAGGAGKENGYIVIYELKNGLKLLMRDTLHDVRLFLGHDFQALRELAVGLHDEVVKQRFRNFNHVFRRKLGDRIDEQVVNHVGRRTAAFFGRPVSWRLFDKVLGLGYVHGVKLAFASVRRPEGVTRIVGNAAHHNDGLVLPRGVLYGDRNVFALQQNVIHNKNPPYSGRAPCPPHVYNFTVFEGFISRIENATV